MFKTISTVILLVATALTFSAQKDTLYKYDIGINLLANNSFNPWLVNGPAERTYGAELIATKYFTQKLGLASGLIVLEKSFGVSPGFGMQNFVYTGLPVFINYNLASFNRFNIKLKGGPILEYLVYKQHPDWVTAPNNINLSFRAELDLECEITNNWYGLINANLTHSIKQGQMGGFRNYGLGLGIIKKIPHSTKRG